MNISRHQEDFILCCVVMFREREKKRKTSNFRQMRRNMSGKYLPRCRKQLQSAQSCYITVLKSTQKNETVLGLISLLALLCLIWYFFFDEALINWNQTWHFWQTTAGVYKHFNMRRLRFFFGNLNANSPHCIREPFNYVLTIREACFFPVN